MLNTIGMIVLFSLLGYTLYISIKDVIKEVARNKDIKKYIENFREFFCEDEDMIKNLKDNYSRKAYINAVFSSSVIEKVYLSMRKDKQWELYIRNHGEQVKYRLFSLYTEILGQNDNSNISQ